MWLKLETITAINIDLSHSRQSDLSGVTNNINKGPVPLRCPSKPWQWASMHNSRTLAPEQLNGAEPSLMLWTTPVFGNSMYCEKQLMSYTVILFSCQNTQLNSIMLWDLQRKSSENKITLNQSHLKELFPQILIDTRVGGNTIIYGGSLCQCIQVCQQSETVQIRQLSAVCWTTCV